MELVIHGNNIDLTDGIKDHIESRVSSIKLFEKSQKIEVRLEAHKGSHTADVNLHFQGKDIHIKQTAEDMYAAIDLLMGKLKRNVIKNKEKHDIHLNKN